MLTIIHCNLTSALAQSRRYNPSPNAPAPTTSRIGGTRTGSCSNTTSTTFTALAPNSQVGRTAASHPTFVLYVPEGESLAIDFRLYQYDTDGQIQTPAVYQTEISNAAGIMPITLPAAEPGLSVGEHYIWQAALICNPARRADDLIVEAEFQTVSDAVPESERWYDLLKVALDNAASDPQSIDELLTELSALERSTGEALQQAASTASESDRPSLEERSEAALEQSLRYYSDCRGTLIALL
ncbi:MAG: DUF928 domain-containing protein [Leptolyngbyaceae cyanobacterium SM1_3_5]|nr:DUF928 domain-containing protein [Leptolyngbyaceae cyanobacterium SM1_3_5]